jgi:hypothetical protein
MYLKKLDELNKTKNNMAIRAINSALTRAYNIVRYNRDSWLLQKSYAKKNYNKYPEHRLRFKESIDFAQAQANSYSKLLPPSYYNQIKNFSRKLLPSWTSNKSKNKLGVNTPDVTSQSLPDPHAIQSETQHELETYLPVENNK